MNGLELSRRFYLEHGEPMLRQRFPEIIDRLAAGLVGPGSECFGFDDELSRDHDFEPGFCIFVPDDLDRQIMFRLEREYAALPREYLGFKRLSVSPVGGSRHGVIVTGDFLAAHTGRRDGALTPREWMRLPEQYLAEVTNGELYFDGRGSLTSVRERLIRMPEDVRRKKLAGNLLLMAQSGQYNYSRCVSRGDTAAAQLSAVEFVKYALRACFNIEGRYMPYYKWSFRAFSGLGELSRLYDALEFLISTDNDKKLSKLKAELIEDVASAVADAACALCSVKKPGDGSLERLAYACNDTVADADLRNLNILYAVD